ncbi:uncharacterized protein BCR38DRAFT_31866 [Pseudomassariella vexata]|uniref:G-patch domain-containing protein n=1 Tax=Pseudomassariella vexata TaxID=1141098 RepID=A0A1Y2DPV9_9PEZI|nr:uncharacterized protein BCR38DRAFT_31866 [Pseudomassariella vexata]ORY61322.1 hypothetical protein BCR38DRAFT_31866 [Pseudomassariella vexata]
MSMSTKRTRAQFESDLRAQQSPYVVFGTPLPPLDAETRDDGSYVPVWKQEVRDERGRKRLHGAFTGGFSAGYFNTVGSKEGWAPSTFVSSRGNRASKNGVVDGNKDGGRQRVEDFMDEEDLADKAESEKVRMAGGFAGLGSTEEDAARRASGGMADLFRVRGETMGVKLLRKMGWKDGQGIGPKVRRKARLDVASKPGAQAEDGETHLFAPENVSMISFVKKLDRKGLGYFGESKLAPAVSGMKKDGGGSSDEADEDGPLTRPRRLASSLGKKKPKPARGGIGIGILNDNGSDDEDPYEIGPRISYNRVIGGDKKKKKAAMTAANPSLRSAPVFIPRKSALAKAAKNLRKCHDGRLPLDGFVFGTETDTLTPMINSEVKYPPPQIPPDWKSSRQPKNDPSASAKFVSTAEAAKASILDPKSRAELLGEAQLPGKSVFDFLSASAREHLAAATGKTDLPPALGEIPKEYALTPEERQRDLLSQLPVLEKETAIAALTRGASGTAPYADNESKRSRYRAYLEHAAGFSKAAFPAKSAGMSSDDWLRELREFQSCAKIFKPMTGMMASRFTTSTTSKLNSGSSGAAPTESELLSKPMPKPADPSEEAARLGMYGAMTRSVTDFYPTRLLCKRFNVRPPAHVQPEAEQDLGVRKTTPPATAAAAAVNPSPYPADAGEIMGEVMSTGAITLDELVRQAQSASSNTDDAARAKEPAPPLQPAKVEIDASVNEALEGKRAQDAVLKAIFGDSSDDDE